MIEIDKSFQTESKVFRLLAGFISVVTFLGACVLFSNGPFSRQPFLIALVDVFGFFYLSFGLAMVAFTKRFRFFNFLDNGKQIAGLFKKGGGEESSDLVSQSATAASVGDIFRIFKSSSASINAQRAFSRATKLARNNSPKEAYQEACRGLLILSQDFIIRDNKTEKKALLLLTLLVEELAGQLGLPGASEKDIRDTFRFLNEPAFPKNRLYQSIREEMLPRLERRIKGFSENSGHINS